MDRLAREMSAVTRVIVILGKETKQPGQSHSYDFHYILCPHEIYDTGAFKTELTCLQIDALKSQIVLFASYLLPGIRQRKLALNKCL